MSEAKTETDAAKTWRDAWVDAARDALIAEIHAEAMAETRPGYEMKVAGSPAYQALKKAPVPERTAMARYLLANRSRIMARDRSRWTPTSHRPGFALFGALVRGTLHVTVEELLDWIAELRRAPAPTSDVGHYRMRFYEWPIGPMVQMAERLTKKTPLSEDAKSRLKEMLGWEELQGGTPYYGTDPSKVRARITVMLGGGAAAAPDAPPPPYRKLSGDMFGDPLEAEIAAMSATDAADIHRLLNKAASASGARPSKTFLAAGRALVEQVGKEKARKLIHDWLARAVAAKPAEIIHRSRFGGQDYAHVETRVFTDSNVTLLKGLVWLCDGFQDARSINLIADLCEKSMRKVPGRGPAAQSTANACLWYLETTPGAEAAARLSRLGTAIKQKSVQKKVQEIVARKAEQAGITTIQLEERVAPDYGLEGGAKTVAFEDYALRIEVEGPGRVRQTWLKPDGAPQKSKPKLIADKAPLKARFDKVKNEVAALKKVLTAQRDRIDRLFAEDVDWPLEDVERFYIHHGLVGTIAARLIWRLETDGAAVAALHRGGAWQDVAGAPVATGAGTRARLWHPVEAGVDETLAWRARLEALALVQPMKQAHREVYLLTDAERATEVYSNRMAAHMLKQHQMATLMLARGWSYKLMGAYDDGLDDQFAYKRFVTSPLRAEYLIHTNWDEENFNDAGIYLYVGTDQLRFTAPDGGQTRMEEVPPRLLSETLREADLFVGVASVGADPAWRDQGPTPESRTYWDSYSFGDLDGFAETRRAVLERLIPRLKIRDVARIEGRFLLVQGKLNGYKIHLGSSNILMSPGDRYLCIVPGAVGKAQQVALPFEGDARLSVILSKALMLAEDDKITAPDIVSQLKR